VETRDFNIGFMAVFLVVMGILFYFFRRVSLTGDGRQLTAFWSALIVLFLLFGIIVVSLYINHVREKGVRK